MRVKDSSTPIHDSGTHGGARARAQQSHAKVVRDPEKVRALESLRLARTELERQRGATSNERRRDHIAQAIAEIDRRMAEFEKT